MRRWEWRKLLVFVCYGIKNCNRLIDWKDKEIELGSVIEKRVGESKCIVLCIDEVNKVYDMNKEEFKILFNVIGALSCSLRYFIVPILAGTVIRPIYQVVSGMNPPCRITLPLLSLESCKKILQAKLPDLDVTDPCFRQVVSDIGGHCRALEFLYDAMEKHNPDTTNYWKEWEVFNQNYFAFRLSLVAYLGTDQSISLVEFLDGAIMNIPVDKQMKIASADQIQMKTLSHRYPTHPSTKLEAIFQPGECVLNASGAPFDAFMWMETTDNKKVLLVLQMKISDTSASTPSTPEYQH